MDLNSPIFVDDIFFGMNAIYEQLILSNLAVPLATSNGYTEKVLFNLFLKGYEENDRKTIQAMCYIAP